MVRALQLLTAGVLLAGFGGLVVYILEQRSAVGVGMPDYSLYASGPKGLSPLAQQLRTLGFKPVPLTRPVYQTAEKGLLILAEPEADGLGISEGPNEDQAKRLLEWVGKGNTLVLWGKNEHAVHRELQVRLLASRTGDPYFQGRVEPLPTAYTERIHTIDLDEVASIVPARNVYLPLWELPAGKGLGAVLLPQGKGRVFIIADPSLLTVAGRERADNALVLIDIVAPHVVDGRVLLDEYHHGFRSSSNFFGYLRNHGQLGLLVQLLIVAVIAVWAAAVRLGPPRPIVTGARADAVDYAGAMARIYQQARVTKWLSTRLAQGFMAFVTRHLRLRRVSTQQEILNAWSRRHAATKERMTELLAAARSLEEGAAMSQRQLLSTARAFDQFRQEASAATLVDRQGKKAR